MRAAFFCIFRRAFFSEGLKFGIDYEFDSEEMGTANRPRLFVVKKQYTEGFFMEKTIRIGGKECRLKTSAALPRLYRQLLGRDIFKDVGSILYLFGTSEGEEEDGEKTTVRLEISADEGSTEQIRGLNFIEDLTYIMHKHGDPTQPDNVEAWLEQFDDAGAVFEVVADVLGLWFAENAQTSVSEKKTGKSTGK